MIAERVKKNKTAVNRTIQDRASLTQNWEPPRKRQTMAYRGPLILRGAQELRFRSPEAMVVLFASFFVSLCCFYVNAYARITSDGINAVKMERLAIEAENETERLQAQLSLLSNAAHVEKRARDMKMIPGATTGRLLSPINPNAVLNPETTGGIKESPASPNPVKDGSQDIAPEATP